ncbi:MAG: hypothetical protein AB7N24_22230 [Dehalococcoidia bacterium]
MRIAILILAPFLLTLLGACNSDEGKHHDEPAEASGHADEGPNGGHLLEVGSHVAHLEVIHDEGTGTITLHVLGSDAKTPFPIAKPPQLKLITDAGPRSLAMKSKGRAGAESSTFSVTDPVLRNELEGRVSIEIAGKIYNPDLEHDHDEDDHEGHDHDGHDH